MVLCRPTIDLFFSLTDPQILSGMNRFAVVSIRICHLGCLYFMHCLVVCKHGPKFQRCEQHFNFNFNSFLGDRTIIWQFIRKYEECGIDKLVYSKLVPQIDDDKFLFFTMTQSSRRVIPMFIFSMTHYFMVIKNKSESVKIILFILNGNHPLIVLKMNGQYFC